RFSGRRDEVRAAGWRRKTRCVVAAPATLLYNRRDSTSNRESGPGRSNSMFRFFRRNREALKRYLLIFFLSVVSIGMVITLAPISGGDTSQTQANVLASIGGTNITTQELRQTIESRMRNYDP